jgi:hypothetical protein
MRDTYTWQLRNPDGGMLGLEFAYARTACCDVVLAHALPQRVEVVVRDGTDRVVAKGEALAGDADTPMARLTLDRGAVRRENIWPGPADLGRPVILPGGEVGELCAWWNAEDGSEWRWRVEFSNRV